jgi:transcriptional regulator with XRE-family HTH domain
VDFDNASFHKSLIDGIHALGYRFRMDTKTESGKRIKAAREGLGLTLKDVCERTNGVLTPTRLSNWEHGSRMISVDEAKRLAPILETTAGYLLTLEDEPGDRRLQTLVTTYKMLDERGRDTVHRVAEAQLPYDLSESKKHDASA